MIDINKFQILEHDTEPWRLIVPRRDLFDWSDCDPRLRSVILDERDMIVSSGFPKFFNLGEREQDFNLVAEAIDNGKEILFYPKYDGSLVIRSAYQDKVILRTRGSFGIGFEDHNKTEIVKLLPERLLDFKAGNGYSILFEYISPLNRVIANYKKSELVCLGSIYHDKLCYQINSPEQTRELFGEKMPGIRYAQGMRKRFNSVDELIEFVDSIKDQEEFQEGIVLKISGQFIKIKNSEYLKTHRAKFHLNKKDIFRICLSQSYEKYDLDCLIDYLDLDYECRDIFDKYFQEYAETLEEFSEFFYRAEDLYKKFGSLQRFEFVEKLRSERSEVFALSLILLDQKQRGLDRMVCSFFGLQQNSDKEVINGIRRLGFKV